MKTDCRKNMAPRNKKPVFQILLIVWIVALPAALWAQDSSPQGLYIQEHMDASLTGANESDMGTRLFISVTNKGERDLKQVEVEATCGDEYRESRTFAMKPGSLKRLEFRAGPVPQSCGVDQVDVKIKKATGAAPGPVVRD